MVAQYEKDADRAPAIKRRQSPRGTNRFASGGHRLSQDCVLQADGTVKQAIVHGAIIISAGRSRLLLVFGIRAAETV